MIRRSDFMKKRNLLLIILITIVAVTLLAFPGSIYASRDEYTTTTHYYYSIISTPFNEELTIQKDYNTYADALSAAKNMAHTAMYRADVQAEIATLSNEDFITYLYDALFHRTPDAEGYSAWLNGLNNGLPRSGVIDYFIDSAEFEMRYIYSGTFIEYVIVEDEHRLKVEELIGRYLEPLEVVHHRNGNISRQRNK
jgi:hypothetical protein